MFVYCITDMTVTLIKNPPKNNSDFQFQWSNDVRKCIFITLSHSVYTPENVSLTIHYNYYLGVLMILSSPFQTNDACR
jgi:hypothetical protein